MDLKQALSYRDKCLVCKRKMVLKSTELAGLEMDVTKNGLSVRHISTSDPKTFIDYSFDGTFQRGNFWDLYLKPLVVCKSCPKCCGAHKSKMPGNTPKGMQSFQPFTTTNSIVATNTPTVSNVIPIIFSALQNLKENNCFYSFELSIEPDGKYETNLHSEFIGFKNKKEFYHVNTDFKADASQVYHASFSSSFEDMLRLTVPAINSSSILSKDQVVKKVKMYNLFS